MDFRNYTLNDIHILLQRINVDTNQVILSVYFSDHERHDEWILFQSAQMARQFIADFGPTTARVFLTLAEKAKKKTLNFRVATDWRIINLDGKHILLERVYRDGSGWEVNISHYQTIDNYFWEAMPCGSLRGAQDLIFEFSDLEVRQFLSKVEQSLLKPITADA